MPLLKGELREGTQDTGEEQPPNPHVITHTFCQGRNRSCNPGAELCGTRHALCGSQQTARCRDLANTTHLVYVSEPLADVLEALGIGDVIY